MAAPKNPQRGPNPKKACKRNRAKRTDVLYEEVRERIRNSRIVNKLMEHVLDDEIKLTSSQVTCGLGLLKKVIPDLSAQDITSNGEQITPVLNVTGKE